MTNRAERFIERANQVHQGKYRYFPEEYINAHTDIHIECPIHGLFIQRPSHHLAGHGCQKCKIDNIRKTVCGVGINDVYNESNTKAGLLWNSMIRRCYSPKALKRRGSYSVCSVCEEWLIFSNFKSWFDENYVEGYHLDKDILVKGNKVYSPETCCFVPKEINEIFPKCDKSRGQLPIGVHKRNNRNETKQYEVFFHRKYIGAFLTPEEAFHAYKQAKEKHIKDMAHKYFESNKISIKVYEALMRYEVEITD